MDEVKLSKKERADKRAINRRLGKTWYKLTGEEIRQLVEKGYRVRTKDVHVLPG
jgi:hypothetical protein